MMSNASSSTNIDGASKINNSNGNFDTNKRSVPLTSSWESNMMMSTKMIYVLSEFMGELVEISVTENNSVLTEEQRESKDYVQHNVLQAVVKCFIPPLPGFNQFEHVDEYINQKESRFGKQQCIGLTGGLWIPSSSKGQISSDELSNIIVIPLDEIGRISLKSSFKSHSGILKTDGEITTAGAKDRSLAKWDGGAELPADVATEWIDDPNYKGFDQFQTNEKLFGVKSTYDEGMYTTILNTSDLDDREIRRAEDFVNEIEKTQGRKSGTHDLGVDEEAKFGAVLGTGAYTNPSFASNRGCKVHSSNTTHRSDVVSTTTDILSTITRTPKILNPPLKQNISTGGSVVPSGSGDQSHTGVSSANERLSTTSNTNNPQHQEHSKSSHPNNENQASGIPVGAIKKHPGVGGYKTRDNQAQRERHQLESLRDEIIKNLHDVNQQILKWMRTSPHYAFDLGDTCAPIIARVMDNENRHLARANTAIGKVVQDRRRNLARNYRMGLANLSEEERQQKSRENKLFLKSLNTCNDHMEIIFEDDRIPACQINHLRSQLGTTELSKMLHGGDVRFLDDEYHQMDLTCNPDQNVLDKSDFENRFPDEAMPYTINRPGPAGPFTPSGQPNMNSAAAFMGQFYVTPGSPMPNYGTSTADPNEMYSPGGNFTMLMIPVGQNGPTGAGSTAPPLQRVNNNVRG